MSLRRTPRNVEEVIAWIEERLRRLDADRRVEHLSVEPTGGAGGVLSGTYPNPGFAQDMATQGELNAHAATSHSGHAIEDEGVGLAQRATMNYVGAGVTATDAGGKTVVTIPGGGHTIEDEGTPLTQRAVLNFAGAGVTASDSAGETLVTIPGGSAGHTIKEDGTPLTPRAGLNFVSGLLATDDAGNDETDINADYATTEIADVAAAEAAGASAKLPRADHVHAHGSGYLPDAHHAQVHSIVGADHNGFPGGTSNFLRADGTFAAPPGGGGSGDLFLAWTAL